MKIEKFEDLICWKKGRELSSLIYGSFRDCKDYGFRDQIERATVSITNNIAEGFEKGSNKEFRRYLHIAKGSCAEVRSMLYIALDLRYLNKEQFSDLYSRSDEISKIISGLSKKL